MLARVADELPVVGRRVRVSSRLHRLVGAALQLLRRLLHAEREAELVLDAEGARHGEPLEESEDAAVAALIRIEAE
eukprot:4986289-Prymnesium_polylepis.2